MLFMNSVFRRCKFVCKMKISNASVTIFTAFQLCRYATKQIFKDKKGRLTQAVMMFTRERPNILIKIIAFSRSQRGQFILFSVVFSPHPRSHHGSVWLLPVISLLLTNTVSLVRACLSIWLERFRGSQKEDERVPLSIKSSLIQIKFCFIANVCWIARAWMNEPFIWFSKRWIPQCYNRLWSTRD